MNTKEKILQDALEELKQKAGDVLEDIMSRLYTDYLPYVETDTECNISYRVAGCIENMLQGKITQVSEQSFTVSDTYGAEHLISVQGWRMDMKQLAVALLPSMGETILKERIKELEGQNQRLVEELKQAYRSY